MGAFLKGVGQAFDAGVNYTGAFLQKGAGKIGMDVTQEAIQKASKGAVIGAVGMAGVGMVSNIGEFRNGIGSGVVNTSVGTVGGAGLGAISGAGVGAVAAAIAKGMR